MKNNYISAIAGWKSAALLALVAMVAAVAFSGVLTSTQTADAAPVEFEGDAIQAAAEPGDTVIIRGGKNTLVTFAISALSTASGSFDANDGQSIGCSNASDTGTCDSDADVSELAVKLNVDADSSNGFILVTRTVIVGKKLPLLAELVINVATEPKAASLTVKAVSTTIVADGGSTKITATVKDDASSAVGKGGESVTFVTTNGVLTCESKEPPDTKVSNVQACTLTTATKTGDTLGTAEVTLKGTNREGTATVTVTSGAFSATVDVTLFGDAKNLSAAPQQGSVEIGGDVYVVLTVTDAAGNPVSGENPSEAAKNGVVGPGTPLNLVTLNDTPMDPDPTQDEPEKMKPAGIDSDNDGDLDITGCSVSGGGTNDDGQCVIRVSAPDETGTKDDATRGTHTLNFELGTLKASTSIDVAGAPASISTDAPASVEALSETEITVTVLDDTDVPVGITAVTVRKIEGGGLVEDQGGANNTENTANGVSKFTYFAGSSAGTITFVIDAGAVREVVTLTIGDPAPEPSVTWAQELVSGWNLVAWSGDDTAASAVEGVSAIYRYEAGSWSYHFSDAGDGIANTLSEVANGVSYFVYVGE